MKTLCAGSRIGNYILDAAIGSGAFATVWKAHHIKIHSEVAIKAILKKSITTETDQTRFLRETSLLKQMDHPFICDLFELLEDDTYYYLVMENIQNGNLLDYVNNSGRLSESIARRYFEEIIYVLEYLHTDKMVAHRDMKCENVLLDRFFNIRVIDFGLANTFSEADPQLQTSCGSPAYAAPEVIRGEKYTNEADIWSTGILLYAIVVGRLPFDDENVQRLLQKVVYNEPTFPSYLSIPLADLLSKMICKNPNQRITLEQIKHHPWFSMTEYEAIKRNTSFQPRTQGFSRGDNAAFEIDHEITEKMNALGIETRQLVSAILSGQSTEATAVYRILRRQKLVHSMSDLMTKVSEISKVETEKGKAKSGSAVITAMAEMVAQTNEETLKNEGKLEGKFGKEGPISCEGEGIPLRGTKSRSKPTISQSESAPKPQSTSKASSRGNTPRKQPRVVPLPNQKMVLPKNSVIPACRLSRQMAVKKPTNIAPKLVPAQAD